MIKKSSILVYVLICVVPMAAGLIYSLLYSLGLTGVFSEGFTLQYWRELLMDAEAIGSLGYTLYLTLLSLLLILSLALYLSWRQLITAAGPDPFYRSLYIPLLFPPLIAAFAWFYLLSPGGILSRLTHQLGWIESVQAFPRLVNDAWGVGILLTHLFLVFPLFTLLFIDESRKERLSELRRTSLTLGSNEWQFFCRIYAPLLLRRSASLIWLYGIFLMGAYEVPLLLGRTSPRVVTIFIRDKMSKYNLLDIPTGHAMIVLYTLLVILIVGLFTQRQSKHAL